MTYNLPPRPDPQTGEPRPPAAPTTQWGSTGDRTKPPQVPTNAFRPPDRGPALEYERTGGKEALRLFAWAFGFFIVAISVIWAIGGENPFAWMQHWYAWLLGLIPSVPFALVKYNNKFIAGADWISNGKKKEWLDLYSLKSADMSFAGTNYYLTLRDNRGERYEMNLHETQWKPRTWDLIYNGILHCYAAGNLRADSMTTSVLKLESQLEHYQNGA